MNAGRYFTIAEKKAVLCPLIESLCHDFNPFLCVHGKVGLIFMTSSFAPKGWGF